MERIFVEILNRSIAAGWVILAVVALRLLIRRAPKWTVCMLWALVAVRLVCPFSFKSAFSLIPSRETVRGDAGGLEGNFVDRGIRFLDDAVNPVLRNSFDSTVLPEEELNGAVGGSRDTVANTGMYPGVNPVGRALSAAGILWIAGMGILTMYSLVSYIRLWHRVRTAVRTEESVYVSEFVDTPFILGVVRPRIYLPSGMPEEMWALVLAHEQAHLRRRDNLWKLCGYALLCVYWFDPLIWVAYTLFCRDLELACDESVIKEYDAHGRRMYSEALLVCSVGRHGAIRYPLAFGEVGVKERIRSVIQYKRPAFWAVVAAVAACIVVAVCFLTDPSADALGQSMSADAEGRDGLEGDSGTEAADPAGTDNQQDDRGETGGGKETGDFDADAIQKEQTEDSVSLEAFVKQWAEAFVNRDGNTIASLVSQETAADLEERELLSGSEGQRDFGFSSPWPKSVEGDAMIKETNPEDAIIYYYAWTSEPHVTVWMEHIFYECLDGEYVVCGEELVCMDNISFTQAFSDAYGYYSIDGSAMDYEVNGAGQLLNDNAMENTAPAYRDLFQPETAVVRLLNLSEDPSVLTVDRTYEDENMVNLELRFVDDLPVSVSMVQPYGKDGIWIPKSYKIDIMKRMQNVDWDEIRSRNLPVKSEPGGWTEIICIGAVPEAGIKLYGYNDKECFGEGVAIEIGQDLHYFDWIYTTPQTILPECYWSSAARQLQVALHVYTGTGVSADKLHVLQYDEGNVLQDYALDFNDMIDLLLERIDFTLEEETGQLRLFDKRDQKELALVGLGDDKPESIEPELGAISDYYLGETIKLLVKPGYFPEGAPIAEYPENMPALEIEVLVLESEGEIRFGLGEIQGVFQ